MLSLNQRLAAAQQQDSDRAAVVCLTCKASKRQCDKRFPVCSRCKKLDKPCEYQLPSQPGPVIQQVQLAPFTDMLWPNACLRCKTQKRRCDRINPKCSRCLRIGANCIYQAANQQAPIIVNGDNIYRTQMRMGFSLLEQPEVGVAFESPIRYHSYMSHLIQFFLTSIALPSDTVVGYSLAHHLRSQWMQQAMSDPCLFHATLFSASTSVDMLRGQQNTARSLYHQTWAIRLINERLARTELVLNYGTVGAVIPLLYYNMVALDRDSAVAHQQGLVKMLLASPPSFRVGVEPLIAIVKVAMLSFACIYDVLPSWDCLFSKSVRPNMLLRSVVSRLNLRSDHLYLEKKTKNAILDVYEAMSRLDHVVDDYRCSVSAEVEHVLRFSTTSTWTEESGNNSHLTPAESLNVCCQICCQLFWEMLRGQLNPRQAPHTTEDPKVEQLLEHLSQVEPLYWIRNAPEAFTWVAFTGAAVSKHQHARVACISKAGTTLTAIDDEKLTLMRQGWRYFRLLRRLAGDDN